MNCSFALIVLTLAAAPSATAQKTQSVSTFGLPSTRAIDVYPGNGILGQTFTVPKNAFKLISFSLYLADSWNPQNAILGFEVTRWLTNTPEGSYSDLPILYTLPSAFNAFNPPKRLDFRGLSLPVTPTKRYLASILVGQLPGLDPLADTDPFAFLSSVGDAYAGGGYVLDGNISGQDGFGTDLMFEAEFTVTPEPATLVLMASGLLAIAFFAIRRSRKEATLGLFLALAATSVANAQSAKTKTLDFEDLRRPPTEEEFAFEWMVRYGGLNWSNLFGFDYHYTSWDFLGAATSGTIAVGGVLGEISSPHRFNFYSAYFMGAHRNGLQLNITGYRGSTAVYLRTLLLNTHINDPATFAQLNFRNIDRIQFSSSGGVQDPIFAELSPFSVVAQGEQFAMDDVTYSVTPEPATLLLLGSGLVGLGFIAHRRMRKPITSD